MKPLQLQPGDIVKYAPMGVLAMLDAPYGFKAVEGTLTSVVPNAIGIVLRLLQPQFATCICVFPPQVGEHVVYINDLVLLQKGGSECEGESANADAPPASPCANHAGGEDT